MVVIDNLRMPQLLTILKNPYEIFSSDGQLNGIHVIEVEDQKVKALLDLVAFELIAGHE